MTHTFLVTIELEEGEDLTFVADEITAELEPLFGPETVVVPWSPHDETI